MRAVCTAVALFLLLPSAMSFAVDGRTNVHKRITNDALPFLRASVLDAIDKANKNEDHGDGKNLPERHFTNCLFTASVTHINAHYRHAAGALFKGDSKNGTARFGELLHTAQDFYSHSAWVDSAPIGLGFSGAAGRNLESGTSWWSLPGPYQRLTDDVVIVEGNPPAGATIVLPHDTLAKPASAVPIVTLEGRRYRGLMTSTTEPISFATALCPPAGEDCWLDETVCIRHGEPRREPTKAGRIIACLGSTSELFENCFHHDDPLRPQYREAFAGALRQTRHEWCRLLHLGRQADTSLYGVSLLLALWVRPDLPQLATPHPVGTPCAPAVRGSVSIGVRLSAVTDTDADYHTLAIYTQDLQRSARLQFKESQLPATSLTLCVDERDTVVVTLWGWKGDEEFNPEDAASGVLTRIAPAELAVTGATLSRTMQGRGGIRASFELARSSHACP